MDYELGNGLAEWFCLGGLSGDYGQEVSQGYGHLQAQLELEDLIQNGSNNGMQVGAGGWQENSFPP